jgi:hypothetical protein
MAEPLRITLTLATLVLAMIIAGIIHRADRPFPWLAAAFIIAAIWR